MSLAYAAVAARHRRAPLPRSDDVQTRACGTWESTARPANHEAGVSRALPRPMSANLVLCLAAAACTTTMSPAMRHCHAPGRCSVSDSPPRMKHNSLVSFPGSFLFCLSSSSRSRRTSCEAGPFFVYLCVSSRQHLGRAVPCHGLRLSPLRASGAIAARRPSLARVWPLAAAHASALPHDLPDS